MELIARGETTIGIGQTLKISPKTVEYHRALLMQRTKLYSIAELTRLAMRLGLVNDNP